MSTQRLYYTCTYGRLTTVQKGELIFAPLCISVSACIHTPVPAPTLFPLPPQPLNSTCAPSSNSPSKHMADNLLMIYLRKYPSPSPLVQKSWILANKIRKQTKTDNVKTTQEIKHYWWESLTINIFMCFIRFRFLEFIQRIRLDKKMQKKKKKTMWCRITAFKFPSISFLKLYMLIFYNHSVTTYFLSLQIIWRGYWTCNFIENMH